MADIFDTEYENFELEINDNKVKKGENINLMSKDPALAHIIVGMGWDLNAFDSDPLDLDVSCFMLDKGGKTRMNEDFVFYNNTHSLESEIVHNGDSRTGAGDGDDESISIDLKAIPYDVMRLVFILSIYRGEEKDHSLSKVRNCYMRLINQDNSQELLRYEMAADLEDQKETAMIIGSLNREGPKWHFEVLGQCVEGGLGKIATGYDIIVQGG